jgi:aspartate-semialdehyde dehydrogenase
MLRVGFVGWRGMVGSVLLSRMRQEEDFAGIEPLFFSSSSPGAPGPAEGGGAPLGDARDLRALSVCDVVISAQGADYTVRVQPALRRNGWRGIWIDASSALRMADSSSLILDPVNGERLRDALCHGTLDFSGANCTVSLMLMGLIGLIRTGEVEWISAMTYQAASGAGAEAMTELVRQMRSVGQAASAALDDPAGAALEVDRRVALALGEVDSPILGAPLAGSLLPWIDRAMPNGQTREEWKAGVEAERILGAPIPVDGLCVRVGALRCHSQGLTIALKRPMPISDVADAVAHAHPWLRMVPNEREATLRALTPISVAGTLDIAVGRLRPMTLGDRFVTAFTVGDQLLWGAAEPLRRMLRIVREHRERP